MAILLCVLSPVSTSPPCAGLPTRKLPNWQRHGTPLELCRVAETVSSYVMSIIQSTNCDARCSIGILSSLDQPSSSTRSEDCQVVLYYRCGPVSESPRNQQHYLLVHGGQTVNQPGHRFWPKHGKLIASPCPGLHWRLTSTSCLAA